MWVGASAQTHMERDPFCETAHYAQIGIAYISRQAS